MKTKKVETEHYARHRCTQSGRLVEVLLNSKYAEIEEGDPIVCQLIKREGAYVPFIAHLTTDGYIKCPSGRGSYAPEYCFPYGSPLLEPATYQEFINR